jgi:hypothetical protein
MRGERAKEDRLQRRNDGTVFERGDRVLDYWLAHSEGFAVVRGSVRRRVEGVVVDPRDGRARTLLVRPDARGRSRAVPAAAVAAVDPFEKVLYLERRVRRPRPVRVAPTLSRLRIVLAVAVQAAAGAVRAAAAAAGRGARAGVTGLGRGIEWSTLYARGVVHGGARGARSAAAWCGPRATACARGSRATARRAAVVSVRGCRRLSAVAVERARRVETLAAALRTRRALRTDRAARKALP